MEIYLKGMEMPTNCASCDIACRHYLDFGADGLLSKICRTESRRPDCPLVPAADVRPVVKAHWYWDKDGMDWNIGAWRCSACKAMSPMWWNTDRGSPMHKSGHNFCPNCGAMMEES